MKAILIAALLALAARLPAQTVTVDFTDPATPTFGQYAQRNVSVNGTATMMLWSGDANSDGKVDYTGAVSDVNLISAVIFLDPVNSSFLFNHITKDIYDPADLNLDGWVDYVGATSDVNLISLTIFLYPGNDTYLFNYLVSEAMPPR